MAGAVALPPGSSCGPRLCLPPLLKQSSRRRYKAAVIWGLLRLAAVITGSTAGAGGQHAFVNLKAGGVMHEEQHSSSARVGAWGQDALVPQVGGWRTDDSSDHC